MIPSGCVSACPGCKQREMSAAESSRQKQSWAESSLAPHFISPIRSPAERWGYRRKSTLHARHRPDGWQFGLVLFRQREEIFIPIPECPVHAPAVNRIFSACRGLPAGLPLAFVQVSGNALLLVLKSGRSEPMLAQLRPFLAALKTAGAESVFVNWNAAAGRRVISSRHTELVAGEPFLEEGGFFHGPTAFRQQIPALEDEAHALAEKHLSGLPRIVDLYCGIGISLARWRKQGREALGVELVGEACTLAEKNAPGAQVLKGKVEERLPQIPLAGLFGIYTNPPRNGQGEAVNGWMNASGAEKIAYLSCNMRSLAADLSALPAYRVIHIQPYDFFPQTDHVEALALLEKI